MNNRLFLPIAKDTIDRILEESITEAPDDEVVISIRDSETFCSLSLHELAALYIINQLPQLNGTRNPKVEIALHGFIDVGLEYRKQSDTPFINEVSSRFSGLEIRKGLELAKERDIYFLPEQDVENAEFLDEQGRWDFEFKASYKHPEIQEKSTIIMPNGQQREMFSNQHRIFRQIERGMSDEHVQVQGYAGSGKTHMLSAVSEILVSREKHGRTILALANSTAQVQALRKAVHPAVQTMTFGQLASFMIPTEVKDPNITRLKQYVRDYDPNPIRALAEEVGLKEIKSITPNRVSAILFQMVARYCWSRDKTIISRHIPKWVGKLSEEDEGYLVAHAEMLWELAINPPSNFPFQLPVRDYHAIKYVSLKGYTIPHYFSHLIVDESHDLNDAMTDIIERSKQGYTGLGDTFQAVNGYTATRQSPAIERQMATSIRTPGKLGNVVNFSLELHSLSVQDEFIANRERPSQIEYYDRPDVPEKPTAIWVDDLWELFEWAERLSALNLPFRVLGSDEQLDEFARGCIRLYRDKKPARVMALSRYKDWFAVMKRHERHRSVNHINKLFGKGYKTENWEKTKRLQSRSAQYVIGLFQNSRNHEFDSVMLAPAIIQQLYEVKKNMASEHPDAKAARGALASRLYLGITRSRHTLILPQSFEEFMHFL